jgi:hypothetical protein
MGTDGREGFRDLVYQEGKKILGEFFIGSIRDNQRDHEYTLSLYDLQNEQVFKIVLFLITYFRSSTWTFHMKTSTTSSFFLLS